MNHALPYELDIEHQTSIGAYPKYMWDCLESPAHNQPSNSIVYIHAMVYPTLNFLRKPKLFTFWERPHFLRSLMRTCTPPTQFPPPRFHVISLDWVYWISVWIILTRFGRIPSYLIRLVRVDPPSFGDGQLNGARCFKPIVSKAWWQCTSYWSVTVPVCISYQHSNPLLPLQQISLKW